MAYTPTGSMPTLFKAEDGVSYTTATPSVELGTLRFEYNTYGGAIYQYIYNTGAQDIAQGECCILTGAISNFSCTGSSVTQINEAFGVADNCDITAACYGWVLKRGFARLLEAGTSNISSCEWITPSTDGAFQTRTTITDYFGGCCAFSHSSTGAGGSFFAYVNCLRQHV